MDSAVLDADLDNSRVEVVEQDELSLSTDSLELIIESDSGSVLSDPYEDMPTLENMSQNGPNLLRTNRNTDRTDTDESLFVTLARYSFPGTDEVMLPGISLEAIFSKSKYLALRWTESGTFSLTTDEKEFLDYFGSKAIESIEMSEWEKLRNIYLARDSWFMKLRDGGHFDSTRVRVKRLRSSIKLLRHLPPCRSLYRTRATMNDYVSVVNLGYPVDKPQPQKYANYDFASSIGAASVCHRYKDHEDQDDRPSTASALRRSARLQKRSDSIVETLKFQIDFDSKCNDGILGGVEDWPFEVDQQVDSGFDEAQVDHAEASIFQAGVPERQLAGFSRDHFQYPADQIILDTGLTLREQEAFEGLEHQLETYYAVPKRKRYRTKAARTADALVIGTAAAKKPATLTSSIPRRSLTNGNEEVSRKRILRSSSLASTVSELLELEIISEEKAIMTSLKVPKEYASIPTPKFLAQHEGKYLREKDYIVDYDDTVPFPMEDLAIDDVAEDETDILLRTAINSIHTEMGGCCKESCFFGCVCESLRCERAPREHCGKWKCIFGCICVARPPKTVAAPGETRDIRLSLRPRGSKWKRPTDENAVAKKKIKRTAVVISDDESRKRLRFRTENDNSVSKVQSDDHEDNYMADIDRAEISSDDGAGSYSYTVLPAGAEADYYSDEEVEVVDVTEIENDLEVEDQAYLSDQSSDDGDHENERCLLRVLEVADADQNSPNMPTEHEEAQLTAYHGAAQTKQPMNNGTRPLYNPLPLEIVTAEGDELTFCVVSVEDDHNVLIEWRDDCQLPKATAHPSVISSVDVSTVLTLPLPSLGNTFYLFKLPSDTDGDIQLHILDMRFVLPLDKLHEATARAAGERTRKLRLLPPDKKRLYAAAGHPCEIYVFPCLPQLLVIGPYPVSPEQGAEYNEEPAPSIIRRPSYSWRRPKVPDTPETVVDTMWNGNGEIIPKDYLDKCVDDFMIEFPQVGDWTST